MTGTGRKSIAILVAMALAAGVAAAGRPSKKIADDGPKVELETLVPRAFGAWRVDESMPLVLPAPDVQAKLDRLYNQTLARTYVNARGERVMLSIAYGGDQSDAMQMHRPEVCYTAQGFQVMHAAFGQLVTDYGVLPVKRLLAVHGPRHEPITYWITVGDSITRAGVRQKLAQLGYGLTGRIPDGMLVRVSTIDRDEARAYGVQEEFLKGLLAALGPTQRIRLAGNGVGVAPR